MITKENIQADLEKIFNHIVQCGMLGNFRKYLEENRFDGDRYSNLRVGQRFYYNMYRFLEDNNCDHIGLAPDLFYCDDKNMVNELLENFYLKVYEQ